MNVTVRTADPDAAADVAQQALTALLGVPVELHLAINGNLQVGD